MSELPKRFGRLVAVHRERAGLTQERLADATGLSTNMIGRIERGQSGARFGSIEKLASVLKVDVAEFFTSEIPNGGIRSKEFAEVSARLAGLTPRELNWIKELLDVVLKAKI